MRWFRRILKWALWALGGLVALILVAIVIVFIVSELRMRETYDVTVAPVAIPTDQAAIEYGEHLATTWALCTLCHGDDFSGDVMFDDMFARVVANNLTTGKGGIGGDLTDEDWVRAIRHGIKAGNRSTLFMLSSFNRFSDNELGAIIAYVKSVPPVDNVLPTNSIRIPGRLFVVLDPDFVLTARTIDHDAPRPAPIPPGPTAAYGEHMSVGLCDECHGENFAGGEPFELDDGTVLLSRNLTPAGNLANWTEEDFFQTMETGVTPEGYALDEEVMPWPEISELTDDELRAIWLFLETLPPAQPEVSE